MATSNTENLPEVVPVTPVVSIDQGQTVVTSRQIAEHFGKRHRDVTRAIRNLLDQLSPEGARNFARTLVETEITGAPKMAGSKRVDPAFLVTRDGFALLAMGFTGKEATHWKIAYIQAFNLMEAKLRELYVAPLLDHREFRAGIKLKSKLVLQEQSRATVRELEIATSARVRRNLWWQLRQINDTLGIPTESMQEWLGADALPMLPGTEGGAA